MHEVSIWWHRFRVAYQYGRAESLPQASGGFELLRRVKDWPRGRANKKGYSVAEAG